MSHTRSTPPAPRSFNKYPTASDGRGASTVTPAAPVGASPLSVGEGKADTSAQMEHLAAQRARLAKAQRS